MRYFCPTLADDTGMAQHNFQNVPYANSAFFEDRLYDPRPFEDHEWSTEAMTLSDIDEYEIPPDTFMYELDIIISERFKQVLEQVLTPEEVEFLPIHLVGEKKPSVSDLYYIPHPLKAYECHYLDKLIEQRDDLEMYFIQQWHRRLRLEVIPPEARFFIPKEAAVDSPVTNFIFREDLVDHILNSGITGIAFLEFMYGPYQPPKSEVPLATEFWASVEEQQAWLGEVLDAGNVGFGVWQFVEERRAGTRLFFLHTGSDLEKVPWRLTRHEAKATLRLSVYLLRPEWRNQVPWPAEEGEFAGVLPSLLSLDQLNLMGQGWYGRFDIGVEAEGVLLPCGWYLPYGWRYVELSEFAELYRWWEHLAGRWAQRSATRSDVHLKLRRSGSDEVDEKMGLTLGAARWWVAGGELRVRLWGRPVSLKGRGLRLLRKELRRR